MTWRARNGNACGERNALQKGVCVYSQSTIHRTRGVRFPGNTSANESRQSLKHLSAFKFSKPRNLNAKFIWFEAGNDV